MSLRPAEATGSPLSQKRTKQNKTKRIKRCKIVPKIHVIMANINNSENLEYLNDYNMNLPCNV